MFTICSYFVHIYQLQYNCNKVTDTQAIAKGRRNSRTSSLKGQVKNMLKTIFEQFIEQGAQCTFYSDGMYWYMYDENCMLVFADTTFQYNPQQIEDLIHGDIVHIRALNIS